MANESLLGAAKMAATVLDTLLNGGGSNYDHDFEIDKALKALNASISDAPALSAEDWTEIYYTLLERRDQLRREGPILQSRRHHQDFVRHLTEIVEKIGPDGVKMYPEGSK